MPFGKPPARHARAASRPLRPRYFLSRAQFAACLQASREFHIPARCRPRSSPTRPAAVISDRLRRTGWAFPEKAGCDSLQRRWMRGLRSARRGRAAIGPGAFANNQQSPPACRGRHTAPCPAKPRRDRRAHPSFAPTQSRMPQTRP